MSARTGLHRRLSRQSRTGRRCARRLGARRRARCPNRPVVALKSPASTASPASGERARHGAGCGRPVGAPPSACSRSTHVTRGCRTPARPAVPSASGSAGVPGVRAGGRSAFANWQEPRAEPPGFINGQRTARFQLAMFGPAPLRRPCAPARQRGLVFGRSRRPRRPHFMRSSRACAPGGCASPVPFFSVPPRPPPACRTPAVPTGLYDACGQYMRLTVWLRANSRTPESGSPVSCSR